MSDQEEARLYNEIMAKFSEGVVLSESELRFHEEYQNRNHSSGVPIGTAIPDFALPDQQGDMRALKDLMGPNGLVLSFARTVEWCPYCRNQLAEAELARPLLQEKGVAVAAITPDPVDLHHRFSDKLRLGYPLLSDIGSQIIERFGIINHNIPENVIIQRFRMPFPGSYLIDSDGVVRDKAFLPHYINRQSVTLSVLRHFGPFEGVGSFNDRVGELTIEVAPSARNVFPGHRFGLLCTITAPSGTEIAAHGADALQLSNPILKDEIVTDISTAANVVKIFATAALRWSAPAEFDHIAGLRHLAGDRLQPGQYPISGRVDIEDKSSGEVTNLRFLFELNVVANAPMAIGDFRPDIRRYSGVEGL